MSSPDGTSALTNQLLALLPTTTYQQLLPKLEPVSLPIRQVLYEENQPIEYVYFPLNAVVSCLAIMDDGTQVEVGTVGYEGFVGVPVFLGASSTSGRAIVQILGKGLRMPSQVFGHEVEQNGSLTRILHRYVQALMADMAQQVACNRLHSVQQRCARWLLTTRDRVRVAEFPLTQEFLAQMLGVRRATVNEVAQSLQHQGLIRYRHGIITVLDAEGLEAAACECYHIVRAQYDRMLDDPFSH